MKQSLNKNLSQLLGKICKAGKIQTQFWQCQDFTVASLGHVVPDMFNFEQKLKRGKPESNFTTLGFLMATLFENEFDEF